MQEMLIINAHMTVAKISSEAIVSVSIGCTSLVKIVY